MVRRKALVIGVFMAAMVVLAGCSGGGGGQAKSQDDLAKSTGKDVSDVELGGSYWYEVKVTEQNQMKLVQKRPPIDMQDSLERQNLIRRYRYLNDQNNMHHVYLLSHGKVVAYYTAQGKVSSVKSKLTNDRQIVRVEDCDSWKTGNDCFKKVESPQMDGSYGTNGNAIFFFTTDGYYVEWNGQYLASEQPMDVQTPPELTRDLDDRGPPSSSEETGTTQSVNETTTGNTTSVAGNSTDS